MDLSLLKTISLALSSRIRLPSQILTLSVIWSFLEDGHPTIAMRLGSCLLQTARSVVARLPVLNRGSNASSERHVQWERMDGKLRQVVSLLLLLSCCPVVFVGWDWTHSSQAENRLFATDFARRAGGLTWHTMRRGGQYHFSNHHR